MSYLEIKSGINGDYVSFVKKISLMGGHFLINGNLLDARASYLLSQAISGTLLSPARAYVTSAPSMTAAWAVADTDLKLKTLPLAVAKKWKLVLFDAEGRKSREETVPAAGV